MNLSTDFYDKANTTLLSTKNEYYLPSILNQSIDFKNGIGLFAQTEPDEEEIEIKVKIKKFKKKKNKKSLNQTLEMYTKRKYL